MAIGQIMVAVGAVIQDATGEILLVKHRPDRKGFWQGKWICPGGKLEYGETIGDGIKREVKEETNLDIELVAPLVPFERIVKDEGRTKLHVIYIDFLARKEGASQLTPGSDVGEARWFRRDEIPGIWQELHDDTKTLLQIANMV